MYVSSNKVLLNKNYYTLSFIFFIIHDNKCCYKTTQNFPEQFIKTAKLYIRNDQSISEVFMYNNLIVDLSTLKKYTK